MAFDRTVPHRRYRGVLGAKLNNFDNIFSCLEHIKRAENDSSVLDILRDFSEKAGFESLIVSGLPHRGIPLEPFVVINHWPQEWYNRYMSRDYVELDPVARRCFQTVVPFIWREAASDLTQHSGAAKVMNEAADFGLAEGICIPVHTEDGMQGCVSFGGKNIDDDPKVLMSLHLLALYAHGRLRAFRRPINILQHSTLSEREREILRWVAIGKTSLDIADILSLSMSTVNFHVENARRKLGTSTRSHTIAEAVQYNLISIH